MVMIDLPESMKIIKGTQHAAMSVLKDDRCCNFLIQIYHGQFYVILLCNQLERSSC